MRTRIVAGNWKMNMNKKGATKLIKDVLEKLSGDTGISCNVIIAPPFPFMESVENELSGINGMFLAAQNCSQYEDGSYTGETSANMIRSMGAEYVIIGHSERRAFFNETSAILKEKIQRSLDANLRPIFCCGEEADDRDHNRHFEVIEKQISEVLFGYSEMDLNNLIVAYEPIWSIGTGNTASPEIAQEMHGFIRSNFNNEFGAEFSDKLPILYGGSCNGSNASELFAKPDIDGGLIGGASLNAEEFAGIIGSCSN